MGIWCTPFYTEFHAKIFAKILKKKNNNNNISQSLATESPLEKERLLFQAQLSATQNTKLASPCALAFYLILLIFLPICPDFTRPGACWTIYSWHG